MRHLWETHLGSGSTHFDPHYHQAPRGEILDHIDWDPGQVLDVGCAGGAASHALKRKYPDCRVTGIELNEKAAEHARSVLDRVVCGDVMQLDLEAEGLGPASFDTMLMFDVLEHLYDPWRALQRLKPLLKPTGKVVACIPNSFNVQIFEELAAGSFRYDIHGLLDITHIRFFTLRDMLALFAQTGYQVLRGHGIPHPASMLPRIVHADGRRVETDHVIIKGLPAERLQELFVLQFVLVARPLDAGAPSRR